MSLVVSHLYVPCGGCLPLLLLLCFAALLTSVTVVVSDAPAEGFPEALMFPYTAFTSVAEMYPNRTKKKTHRATNDNSQMCRARKGAVCKYQVSP